MKTFTIRKTTSFYNGGKKIYFDLTSDSGELLEISLRELEAIHKHLGRIIKEQKNEKE